MMKYPFELPFAEVQADLATVQTGVEVSQGFVRTLDRKIRLSPLSPLADGKVTVERVKALIDTACRLLKEDADRNKRQGLYFA